MDQAAQTLSDPGKEAINGLDTINIYIKQCDTEVDSHDASMTALEVSVTNLAAIDRMMISDHSSVEVKQLIMSTHSKPLCGKLDTITFSMERYTKHIQTAVNNIAKYLYLFAQWETHVNNLCYGDSEVIVKNEHIGSMDVVTDELRSVLTDIEDLRAKIASVVARIDAAKDELSRIAEAEVEGEVGLRMHNLRI
jgi:hypothetical protein